MKENKATENIIIRVSQEEKEKMQKKANDMGKNLSEYIKGTCLNFMTEQEEIDFVNKIHKLYDKAYKENDDKWQSVDKMTDDMKLRKDICKFLLEHGRKYGIEFMSNESGIKIMFAK